MNTAISSALRKLNHSLLTGLVDFQIMRAFSWWALADEQFVVSTVTIVYYSWILLLISTSTSTVFRSAFYRIFIVTG